MSIILQNYNGITILRDDLLPGGTKSILMPAMINPDADEIAYASSRYGGLQVALSHYCKSIGKPLTIVTAQHKSIHKNTMEIINNETNVIYVFPAHTRVIEARLREYVAQRNVQIINFGAFSTQAIELLKNRAVAVIAAMPLPPDQIWCAVGSGTLITAIAKAVGNRPITVHGVCVGKVFESPIVENIKIYYYNKKFGYECRIQTPFPCNANYEKKAYELMLKYGQGRMLFWNVYS